jgi:hypothetical protein
MAETETKRQVKSPLAVREGMPMPTSTEEENGNTLGNKMATVAMVGLGVALIEAELIPGMLIGVAAMLVPDLFPRLGRTVRPLVKGTIRAGYAMVDRARETMAEAGEQVEDMVAEVKAEQGRAKADPVPAKGHA